jgi:conjugal transfer pilus assembly protein TraI
MAGQLGVSSPYASSDPGFPALAVDELLCQQAALLARIKLCHGSDRADFEATVVSLIRRYADLVHLLPATAGNYFSNPGGLLHLGLEVGFFALQGTDAHIFSGRSTISARRHLEPRWRLATFIAGLCCEAHRVLSHMLVTEPTGEIWSAYLHPLATWLQDQGAERYFLRWRAQAIETRGLGLFALVHVVPPSVMHYLSQDNTVIVPHMTASVSGMSLYRDHNVLDDLVRRSLALVIDRNLTANADRYGTPQYGSHLERYLVDALRHLASEDSGWLPNRERSRVWFGEDGLFLVWPGAAEDVQKLLDIEQLPGIPKAPATMMEVLLSAGVFEAKASDHQTWSIQPPGAKAPIEAAKLLSVAILYPGIDQAPTPLKHKLLIQPVAAVAGPPAAQLEETIAPSPMVPPGAQLQLITDEGLQPLAVIPVAPPPEGVSAEGPVSPPTTAQPSPETFKLQAPLRLNPAVRDALTEVIRSFNPGAGPAQCCTVALGLFVPLAVFERRGLQPSLVLRALADVRMLARSDAQGPPTVSRDFNGTPTVGLILDPRFVDGLDLEGFMPPDGEEA